MKLSRLINYRLTKVSLGLVTVIVLAIVTTEPSLGARVRGGAVCLDKRGGVINLGIEIGGVNLGVGGAWGDACRARGGIPFVPPPGGGPIDDIYQLVDVLVVVLEWVQVVFWILAVGFGLYAAFLYLTAAGSPEQISKAHKTLIYTVIAIVVAVVAYSIPRIVTSILGAT